MLNSSFIFLGTGASMGIPIIGCQCSVCQSKDKHNKRLRPSGLLIVNDKKILIDCGPDFREQALKHHINRLDGILFTHAHNDHTAGIDELRVYNIYVKKPIPCLLSAETEKDIRHRFHYIFHDEPEKLTSRLHFHHLENRFGEVVFEGIPISYVTYEQAGMQVNGFRIGNFAYLSDIKHYSEDIFKYLQGVETLVISALRYDPTPFHLGIHQAMELSKRIGASKTWITHIAHELDHASTNESLPPDVRLAYDGLELNFLL